MPNRAEGRPIDDEPRSASVDPSEAEAEGQPESRPGIDFAARAQLAGSPMQGRQRGSISIDRAERIRQFVAGHRASFELQMAFAELRAHIAELDGARLVHNDRTVFSSYVEGLLDVPRRLLRHINDKSLKFPELSEDFVEELRVFVQSFDRFVEDIVGESPDIEKPEVSVSRPFPSAPSTD